MCKPFCIDWRGLTNGSCDVQCPEGLVYRECQNKLDDFCYGGVRQPGAFLDKTSTGCFCPDSLLRAGNHSDVCMNDCNYCKGALGEPKLPGEVWFSNCHMCTCNNQTFTEECFPIHAVPKGLCSPNCDCMDNYCNHTSVNETCSHDGKIYMVHYV
ncbi:mucin-5B-like [Xenentodon cancila]